MRQLSNIKPIDQYTLLENCLQNKEWAQKELYDLFSPELFPICYRYATDMNEAKDILQEGFIRIFTNLKQFRNEGSLVGWMKRVVTTTALNYIKKNRKKLLIEISNYSDHIPETSSSVLDTISAKEVMDTFEKLPYAYRTIMGLHIIEGLSSKEICKMLNLEESNCRTRLHRGRLMLQKLLQNLNMAIAINK